MLGDIDLRVDGRTMAVSLVSGSFFHVVGVNPVMGRPFGAADDDRAGGNPVVVLSDKGWQRHFNRDPNVLGRTVLVAGAPFEIVGVMPMGFRGLEVSAPDFWAPLPRLADFRPGNAGDQDSVGVEIIGRLKPDVSISAGYFDVLGIPIVRGRPFAATERDDCPVVIVSESVARVLWPNRSGVGETFWLAPDSSSRPSSGIAINPGARPNDDAQMPPRMVTVVGVSRDVAGFRLTDVKDAGVFLPTALEVAMTSVVARVQGDPGLARQTLIERLTRIDPSRGMIVTLRTVARLETFFLQIAFWMALILGGLALSLTVSGPFSVLSYLVEQRSKEIGVRMALGASARQLTLMILLQTARPMIYGLLAGTGLAATLATVVLATSRGCRWSAA